MALTCDFSARTILFGAFQEWTSDISGSPLRLVGAVIRALTTATDGRPVVIAVDDAHLLDELSAFVLHQLARRRVASVIVSIRSGEPAPDAVTALWKERHLRLLEPQALSRAESDELLEAVLGSGWLDEARRQLLTADAVFETYGDVSAVCYRFTIATVEILARLGDVSTAATWLVDMGRRRHPALDFVEPDRMLATSWVAAAAGHDDRGDHRCQVCG